MPPLRLIVTDTSPLITLAVAGELDLLLRAKIAVNIPDSDVVRRRAMLDVKISLVSTGDYLRALEGAKLIQSSDHVLDKAALGGRNVDRQRKPSSDEAALDRLKGHLRDVRRS